MNWSQEEQYQFWIYYDRSGFILQLPLKPLQTTNPASIQSKLLFSSRQLHLFNVSTTPHPKFNLSWPGKNKYLEITLTCDILAVSHLSTTLASYPCNFYNHLFIFFEYCDPLYPASKSLTALITEYIGATNFTSDFHFTWNYVAQFNGRSSPLSHWQVLSFALPGGQIWIPRYGETVYSCFQAIYSLQGKFCN